METKTKFQTIVRRDGVDSIMFEGMKASPRIAELCEKSDVLTQDVFTSFYTHEPKIEGSGPQRGIVETFLNMPEFKDLRASTKSDDISSALGTVQFAPELIKKFEEVQKEIEKRREKAGEDKDELVDGQIPEDLLPGLRQAFRASLKDAQEKADEWQDVAAGWGITPGELSTVPPEERMELAERLLSTSKLRGISDLVGRFKNIVNSSPATVFAHGQDEIVDVGIGSDVSRMLPSEIVKLVETPDLFYRDYLEGKLLSYELKGVENQGKGPIIACLDISASMSGEREMWAKAVCLALAFLAEKQKRAFGFVAFEADVKVRKFFPRQSPPTLQDRLDIASVYCNGGGTAFLPPLEASFDMRAKECELKPADIVFITDGECELSDEELKRVVGLKQQTQVRIYGIAVNFGYGGSVGKTLVAFSDEMATVSSSGEIDLVKKLINKTASETAKKEGT